MTVAAVSATPLVQFAVLDALLAGSYASGIPASQLLELGDFGIGCCDGLGGEVVVLDGVAYECTVDGAPNRMSSDELLPFAEVCRFPAVAPVPLAASDHLALTREVESRLASRNLFHAVRLDGAIAEVRVRATAREGRRHRPLAEVVRDQVETVLSGARGTLVGFWVPPLYQGIAVAGLHLHYLADDRSAGGHVLDLAGVEGALRLAALSQFDLRLPTDAEFLATELDHDADAEIETAENVSHR